MIIPRNRVKVKSKALSLLNKSIPNLSKLSKPIKKFMLEMSMGILITGSCNVNLIAAALQEHTKVKHTLKRLQRMLLNSKILQFANQLSLKESVKKITELTVIAHDGGDITHQYGKKFEKATFVRDGNNGRLRHGYWLNQISGYNPVFYSIGIFSKLRSSFCSQDE